jgi:hypothetical protein
VSAAAEGTATRKRALLLFSLLKAESDSFVSYVRRRLRPRFEDGTKEAEGLDRLAAAFEAETRKAMDVELVGVALMKDPDAVLNRLEDAAALFRDLFQQSVIGLAETFSSGIDARALFPEYRARLDQSLRLREELGHLARATQDFLKTPDKKTLRALVTEIESFRQGGMRYLMFKDWSLFERFHAGFSRERAPRAFVPAANQFDGFLRTLVKEVGKRAVLADHPLKSVRPDAGSGGASRYN